MKDHSKTKALLICGMIAGPLFMLAVLIQGAVRTGYDSFLYPLSSLSIAKSGWIQISNFIVTGTLLLFFSIGLSRAYRTTRPGFRGPLLIGLVGIGLTGAGIFVTDPLFGYPASQPLALSQFTFHGHLHDAFSMLVFVCLPWACFAFRKRFIEKGQQGWARYSAFTGYAIIVTFIISSMGFKQLPVFVDFAGVFQRLCISFGWLWILLLAFHTLNSQPKSG